jgi:hypothetical protein
LQLGDGLVVHRGAAEERHMLAQAEVSKSMGVEELVNAIFRDHKIVGAAYIQLILKDLSSG